MIFKAVVRAILLTALIACLPNLVPARGPAADAVRQQSGNTVLYDHRSGCWEGAEPAHVDVPGHVILRIEGGTRGGHWFYGGPDYVHIALIDIFEKDNPRVYVRAFCA